MGKDRKFVAALFTLVAGLAVSACTAKGMWHSNGVPLDKLDMSGPAPHSLSLAGPDRVVVTQGDQLRINVEGSDAAKSALRFELRDGALAIGRESNSRWDDDDDDLATIHVVMPAPQSLKLAGSGQIQAAALDAARAQIGIAGSGAIETPQVATQSLAVKIAGSGDYRGAGKAQALELNIAGSGEAAMAMLQVGQAHIKMAGSGTAGFASDGDVKASITGSGEVRVIGRARCTVKAVGSGKLVCESTPHSA